MAEQPFPCPFCSLGAERVVLQNELALALLDAFPVTPGHTLVVPRRHVADYFDMSLEEHAAVWELVCGFGSGWALSTNRTATTWV